MIEQLSLLDDSGLGTNRLASVDWSYSRRGVLEQCPRRYYYEYFGSNSYSALDEPLKPTLRFLKALQNRYQIAGDILHRSVARFLAQSPTGEMPTADSLAKWALGQIRSLRSRSRGAPPLTEFSTAPADQRWLAEYTLRDPAADQLYDDVEDRLNRAVYCFVSSPLYQSFRYEGRSSEALVEHHFRLTGFPFSVQGKVDLAYRTDGIAEVVDWKLGRNDGAGDDSLQLAVYGLWAKDHFRCHPSEIRVRKAFLGSAELIEFRADTSALAAARARVIQDADRMAEAHTYGVRGIVEAFTPSPSPGICRLCAFHPVCPAAVGVVR